MTRPDLVIPLHQVPHKRKDKTAAARAKAYRKRKRQEFKAATAAEAERPPKGLLPPDSESADGAIAEPSEWRPMKPSSNRSSGRLPGTMMRTWLRHRVRHLALRSPSSSRSRKPLRQILPRLDPSTASPIGWEAACRPRLADDARQADFPKAAAVVCLKA